MTQQFIPQPQLVPLPPFLYGVDKRTTASRLQDGFVADAQNFKFRGGVATQRHGYRVRTKSNGEAGGAFPVTGEGRVLGLGRFWKNDGTRRELMFTQTTAYWYDYSAGTVTSVTYDAGQAAGSKYPCFDDTEETTISWCIAPDSSGLPVIIFANGGTLTLGANDYAAYVWDGSAADTQANLALTTTLTAIKQVIYYADHLLVGDYTDASGNRTKAGVLWGDLQELDLTLDANDAGERLLTDAQGYMLRFIRLGSHLAIYFTNSIVICDPIGTDEIYNFDTRVTGIGLLGPNAVVDMGGFHIFIGNDRNVYLYDAGLRPQAIGDRVQDDIISAVAATSPAFVFGEHLPQEGLVVFHIGIQCFAYNYIEGTWAPTTTHDVMSASGVSYVSWAAACNEDPYADTACNDTESYALWRCSDFTFGADDEHPLLADTEGYVYENLEICTDDNGHSIPAWAITRNYPLGKVYGGMGWVADVIVETKGGKYTLEYSTNEGASWTTIVSAGGGHLNFTVDEYSIYDLTDRFIQFRLLFESATSRSYWRHLGVDLRPDEAKKL